MDKEKEVEKEWFTVSMIGKHKTIIKDVALWEQHGYRIKETETEILLIKQNGSKNSW